MHFPSGYCKEFIIDIQCMFHTIDSLAFSQIFLIDFDSVLFAYLDATFPFLLSFFFSFPFSRTSWCCVICFFVFVPFVKILSPILSDFVSRNSVKHIFCECSFFSSFLRMSVLFGLRYFSFVFFLSHLIQTLFTVVLLHYLQSFEFDEKIRHFHSFE